MLLDLDGKARQLEHIGIGQAEACALGGDGGAIALDRRGNIAMPFNTSGMYRAWLKPDGTRGTAIFRDDK